MKIRIATVALAAALIALPLAACGNPDGIIPPTSPTLVPPAPGTGEQTWPTFDRSEPQGD